MRARKRPTLLATVAVWIATAAAIELGLRVLPTARWNRWIGVCSSMGTATPLHHAPHPGVARQRLGAAEIFGAHADREYEEIYDELGIKRSKLRPQEGNGTKVLFLGDSFIQGYDDANTIPQLVYQWIIGQGSWGEPLIVLNAGYSSYSPLIFTVQARRLVPELQPDFLVIDIDETDLFDDAVRYRDGVERNAEGRLVAIHPDPRREALFAGCAEAGDHPLLTVQLLASSYYQFRLLRYDRSQRLIQRPLALAETPEQEISAVQREQMSFFSSSLEELFTTLTEYLARDRILVVRHPHQRHLDDGHGSILNRKVGELVRGAAARHSIRYFDAQDDLQRRFGNRPQAYYWNGDMHFNFEGMRAYSELVGRELLKMMQDATLRQ